MATLHHILLFGDIDIHHKRRTHVIFEEKRKILPPIFNGTSISNTTRDKTTMFIYDKACDIDIRERKRNLYLLDLLRLELALSGTFQPNSDLGRRFSDRHVWKNVNSFLE
jgi:hypothetical protein